MKAFLVFSILLHSFNQGVEGWQLRKVDRQLKQGFDFIVSSDANSLLCITAVEGTTPLGLLELESCDFANAPTRQLWRRQGSKLVSGLDSERCLRINQGTTFSEGALIRLGSCNDNLTDFTLSDELADFIRVLDNQSFCLTSSGSNANSGDYIHAKSCLDRSDYKWSFVASSTPTTTATPVITTTTDTLGNENSFGALYELFVPEANACVQPQNHEDSQSPIILDNCNAGRAWHVKEHFGGEVVFHSAIDFNLCLQAGFCQAVSGTYLRLLECDEEEGLQYFTWQDFNANIKLSDQDDLCMVYQGITAEVGDTLIMKNCADRTYEWSG